MKQTVALSICCAAILMISSASAQFGELLEQFGMGKPSGLSESKIVSGLKEALQIGTEKTVSLTGQLNGFFGNEAIKILMPEKLQTLETALRTVGYGPKVDEFVVSMNRAAEEAAPLAGPIFREAIEQMSFEDAKRILNGGDTAATDYFKAKTGEKLAVAFLPKVEQATSKVGVTAQYKALVGQYQTIPFMQPVLFDPDEYVVVKSLDGLFHVLGEQERKIRQDPAARVTDLLQEVFGK